MIEFLKRFHLSIGINFNPLDWKVDGHFLNDPGGLFVFIFFGPISLTAFHTNTAQSGLDALRNFIEAE